MSEKSEKLISYYKKFTALIILLREFAFNGRSLRCRFLEYSDHGVTK